MARGGSRGVQRCHMATLGVNTFPIEATLSSYTHSITLRFNNKRDPFQNWMLHKEKLWVDVNIVHHTAGKNQDFRTSLRYDFSALFCFKIMYRKNEELVKNIFLTSSFDLLKFRNWQIKAICFWINFLVSEIVDVGNLFTEDIWRWF